MENLINFFNDIFPLSEKVVSLMREIIVYDELKKGFVFHKRRRCCQRIFFFRSWNCKGFYVNNEGKEYNKSFFSAPSIVGSLMHH